MSNKRAALYVRVSTDAQTVENQIRELRQVAERRGWEVIEVYSDAGISGAKSRNGRPGLDSMLKDASRRKFDIVMAWAIDRLGRSLVDLLDTIQHLEACGVDLYLDQQAIDTTTPMGKLVFQVTGAFAEFERSMIRQRVKAGLKRAVAQGVKLGRPKIDSTTERKVRKQLAKGMGILKVAKSLGIGTGTVQRIANELRGKEDDRGVGADTSPRPSGACGQGPQLCTVSTHDGVVRQQRERSTRGHGRDPPTPRRESRVFIKAPSPNAGYFFTQGRSTSRRWHRLRGGRRPQRGPPNCTSPRAKITQGVISITSLVRKASHASPTRGRPSTERSTASASAKGKPRPRIRD